MDYSQLTRMSQTELARLLRQCGRGSDQWRELRAECERRSRRWEQVADYALVGLLVCFGLVASAVIVG